MKNKDKTTNKLHSESLKQHNVSGSDSIKSCQNCTFYTSDKNRCNHKYWSWCVKRDDEGYVTSYAYHFR